MRQPPPDPDNPQNQAARSANALALSYQPRRRRAAAVSIAWNLLWLGLFLYSRLPERLLALLSSVRPAPVLASLYSAIFFALYLAINLPIDLYYGYIHERTFALVKQGLRRWARDWLHGVAHHAILFILGATLILTLQNLHPTLWLPAFCLLLLILFLASTTFAADLLPTSLFDLEHPTPSELARLHAALGPTPVRLDFLPPIFLFTATELRDYCGGLIGLGPRQLLLISRPTMQLASLPLLRFILLHELGHRRTHHLLLSTLAGWLYVAAGLALCNHLLLRLSIPLASPLYIPWLALFLTLWMILGQPALAYLGRRLEYAADRFYLDHRGTVEEMRLALLELASRNLARTDITTRRQSIFESLPTIPRRLRAASRHQPKPPITSTENP